MKAKNRRNKFSRRDVLKSRSLARYYCRQLKNEQFNKRIQLENFVIYVK